ncbi:MAG: DUF1553 domain-containing protein [Pirellulaceae bacterium]|nr:DUF1553 domain-containing protein [Pirellulaceae bacterium]
MILLRAIRICLILPAIALAVGWGDCGNNRSTLLGSEPDPQQIEFFERKIRPVLVKHCYECHSADSDVVQGGLRLDHADAMIRGGDMGAAVTPGKPDESLLLTAIRYEEMEMPPAGPLDESIVQDFQRWIEMGAADPRTDQVAADDNQQDSIDWSDAKSFWAFQSPTQHPAPRTTDTRWTANKVDAFILHALESNDIKPGAMADRPALIRRITFDLIGLPPTAAEVDRFVDDVRPDAYRRLVDRLLSDPRQAERWTRMWLDVVRYAEDQAHIVGGNDSLTYPNAYLYRDWVIDSFANDLPYDEFLRMQLAADLIAPEATDSHLALGLLGLGPKYYRRNDATVMADEWEDRVDTISRGLLGLTVACARCHDHKFDPIPTSDYYALAGVFAGTEMFNRPIDATESSGKEIDKNGQAKKPQQAVHIVRDGDPRDLNIMIRGDANVLGDIAPRGFLTVLSPDDGTRFTDGSGRAELADAIVDQSNPLTARVIVNRVWMRMMGKPLVATPSNFGALGQRPSHPELLDDLAARFMDNGWSVKWLQRELALSSTYRQSSEIQPSKMAIDPSNRLYWRMPRRRLGAEAYRDALLSVSDGLENRVGGSSMAPDDADSRRRTVYSKVSRLDLNPMLARFDFPDPNAHSAGRYETTTPLQKLFLLNSPFMVRQSDATAELVSEMAGSNRSKIEMLYKRLFGRLPNDQETAWGESFLDVDDPQVLSQYVQALLISNEMFILD